MKKVIILIIILGLLIAGCGEPKSRTKGVYMLLDTSGTYTKELPQAQSILNYLLGVLQPGDTLAVASIDEVVHGDGHFLGQPETLQRMQSDFVYPEIGDRSSIDEWEADGSKDIREVARDRTRRILQQHFPRHLPAEIDSKLRDNFDIRLPQAVMGTA